ncbi:hypothetical protein M434DRAFT_11829 [Hypoxylon sp. CO27-5]|nr:hypothetical protein M434DRAFT_11829 [Hypoxylon sp. CO27-5]
MDLFIVDLREIDHASNVVPDDAEDQEDSILSERNEPEIDHLNCPLEELLDYFARSRAANAIDEDQYVSLTTFQIDESQSAEDLNYDLFAFAPNTPPRDEDDSSVTIRNDESQSDENPDDDLSAPPSNTALGNQLDGPMTIENTPTKGDGNLNRDLSRMNFPPSPSRPIAVPDEADGYQAKGGQTHVPKREPTPDIQLNNDPSSPSSTSRSTPGRQLSPESRKAKLAYNRLHYILRPGKTSVQPSHFIDALAQYDNKMINTTPRMQNKFKLWCESQSERWEQIRPIITWALGPGWDELCDDVGTETPAFSKGRYG